VQVDARLNVGCSGGALVNLKGELVGLTSSQAAIAGSDAPAGFAVPLDADMWRIIDKLKEGEEVEYGFLGVQLYSNRDTDVPSPNGVYIQAVVNGSAADMADKDGQTRIQAGDAITKIDGYALKSTDDLFAVLGCKLAGSTVKLQLSRRGVMRETTVKL